MSEQRSDVPESVRIHRIPERGRYDRASIDAILDASVVCHLAGIDVDGRPLVIPMQHARVGDVVYLHGSAASRHLKRAGAGTEVSLAVTILDGLVLAHRMFNHSVNYRSVVLRGEAVAVDDDAEKLTALEAFSERLLPGRWAEAIGPDAQELRATTVLRLPIDEAAAKVREGGPGHVDEEDDLSSIWVGVIPIREVAGDPQPHPDIPADVPLSPAAAAWVSDHR
ncbi:MAG TPA: pyridoxamine 5'-phosphate oxidase family protein [Candidatus Nanopelagicales bacterium]|nr:pyridoxamine 5'-phosphate oxidase family protein [Candidatus Nanopelagicales bacterium]